MSAHLLLSRASSWPARCACLLAALALAATTSSAESESEERESAHVQSVAPVAGKVAGARATLTGTAVVNFADLARLERLGLAPEVRVLDHPETINEMDIEPGADIFGPPPPEAMFAPPRFVP